MSATLNRTWTIPDENSCKGCEKLVDMLSSVFCMEDMFGRSKTGAEGFRLTELDLTRPEKCKEEMSK